MREYSPDGSDWAAAGSSRTVRPRLSGFLSGRGIYEDYPVQHMMLFLPTFHRADSAPVKMADMVPA